MGVQEQGSSQTHNHFKLFGRLNNNDNNDDDDGTDVSSDGSQTISSRLPLLHHHLGGASDKSITSVSSFLHSARQAYDVLHAQQTTVHPIDDESIQQQQHVPNPVIRLSSEGHRSSVSAVSIDSFSLTADTVMALSTSSRKSSECPTSRCHWMNYHDNESTIDEESLYLTELEELHSKNLQNGANFPSALNNQQKGMIRPQSNMAGTKCSMNTSTFKERLRRDDSQDKDHSKSKSIPPSYGHKMEPSRSILSKKRNTYFPPIQEDSQFIDSDWEDDIVRGVAANYHAGEDLLFLDTDDEQSLSDIQTLSSQSTSLASTLNHFHNDIRKEFEAEIAADEAAHRQRLQQLLHKCKTLPVSAFANSTKNNIASSPKMTGKSRVDRVQLKDRNQPTSTAEKQPLEKQGALGSKSMAPSGQIARAEPPKHKEASRPATIESILQDVDSFLALDCESEERSDSALHLSSPRMSYGNRHNDHDKQSKFSSEPPFRVGNSTNYMPSRNLASNRFQQQQQLHVENMMGLDRTNPLLSGTAKYFAGDGRFRSTSSDSSVSSVQYEQFDRKAKRVNKVDEDSVTTTTSDSDIRTIATNGTPLSSSGSDCDIRSVAAMSISTKQYAPSSFRETNSVLSQNSRKTCNKGVLNQGPKDVRLEGLKSTAKPQCDPDPKAAVGLAAFWNRWKRSEI
jgi:hypothetical protein